MNHFFALELSPEARQAVDALMYDWKRLLLPIQHAAWYGSEDYHITLKFLGNLPETMQSQLIAATAPIAEAAVPFPLSLAGAGMFPNSRYPKVLWAGVAPSPPLSGLAAQLNAALAAQGFAQECRPYMPHITVARCRHAVEGECWPLPNEHQFVKWMIAHFVLMQTIPPDKRRNESKSRYNIVHTFPFGNLQ